MIHVKVLGFSNSLALPLSMVMLQAFCFASVGSIGSCGVQPIEELGAALISFFSLFFPLPILFFAFFLCFVFYFVKKFILWKNQDYSFEFVKTLLHFFPDCMFNRNFI